jgi:methylated-DNA-protein-cysteine methyltransferase related protein
MRSTKRISDLPAFASRSSSAAKGHDGDTRFTKRVIAIIRRVPVGRVTTYGTVAALAGKPRAARAVGNIMREAHVPGLPYHRVIAANGHLGGYSSLPLKRQLLAAEGHTVTATKVKNFAKVAWP